MRFKVELLLDKNHSDNTIVITIYAETLKELHDELHDKYPKAKIISIIGN